MAEQLTTTLDQPFKMLSSYLTWNRLYNYYMHYYNEINVWAASLSDLKEYISYFTIAKTCCPDNKIRVACSNVCDKCSVFSRESNTCPIVRIASCAVGNLVSTLPTHELSGEISNFSFILTILC